VVTFGLSAIGAVAGAAQTVNAIEKVGILEEEANRRNHELRLRQRDFIARTSIGATVGAVSHGTAGHAV
jgi:ABC-type oligopeptide transport system ATPase subunit